MGTWKYINLFTSDVDTHIQRVGYIISGQYVILNVFLPFFLSFSLSLNWEREREREYIIGYREKQSYNLLIFSDGFLWRIFSLLRADGLYVIFSSGLKVWLLLLVQDSFRFLYPESWHETRVLSRRPHLQKLIFLFPISADGRRGLFPFWDSSQSFGFYLLPSPVRRFEWGHGVQIAWPTFFFFLQRPAEVNLHSLFVF